MTSQCLGIAVNDQVVTGRKPSRQCSRCSSVVYCSIKCQTEDWNKLHRVECHSADVEHRSERYLQALSFGYRANSMTGRRVARGWYSHTSRAFHALLVSASYEDDPSEPDDMMVLDYATTGEARVDSRSIAGWWDGKEFDSCHPPDYLRPRFESLMEKYTSLKETMRIAEAVLPALGREGEIYLTVLLKKDGESFAPVFTVARYG